MSPFDLLNDDVLLQVLLRTRASDHPALHETCRRFHGILDSKTFRRERALTEWAEVEAMVDEDELEGHYPGLPIVFTIQVDGKQQAGTGSFVTIGRRNTRSFYEDCDAVSSDLEEVGCRLFNNRGIPKVASVEKALGPIQSTRKLLYIAELEWKDEYRNSSWIGANGLRSLLVDTGLARTWSVAVYVPTYEAQITEETRHLEGNSREKWTEEDYDLIDQLHQNDASQFFRAGFQQVQETISRTSTTFLFAVPSFIEGPLLSAKEAEAIRVVDKGAPNPPSGHNLELLQCVKDLCAKKTLLMRDVQSASADATDEKLREFRRETQRVMGIEIPETITDETPEPVRELVEILNRGFHEKAAQVAAEAQHQLTQLDVDFRQEVARYLEKGATVEGSTAIHGCIASNQPDFIDILLEFVPESERGRVVNAFNEDGKTPLMEAAGLPLTGGLRTAEFMCDVIERLIRAGADKDIVDAGGETALGKLRERERNTEWFPRVLGLSAGPNPATERAKALLQPTNGPTTADDALLASIDSEDDSDNDSDDEMEEDGDY